MQGRNLLTDITRARVTMPKSAGEYIERCARYGELVRNAGRAVLAGAAPLRT